MNCFWTVDVDPELLLLDLFHQMALLVEVTDLLAVMESIVLRALYSCLL